MRDGKPISGFWHREQKDLGESRAIDIVVTLTGDAIVTPRWNYLAPLLATFLVRVVLIQRVGRCVLLKVLCEEVSSGLPEDGGHDGREQQILSPPNDSN